MRGSRSADILLTNARVLTLDPACPGADAVAIKQDRILAVGPRDELVDIAGFRTQVIDVGGAIVIPSFHDPHLHLFSYARQRARVDCRGALSPDDLVGRIAAHVASTPEGQWIRAAGFDD